MSPPVDPNVPNGEPRRRPLRLKDYDYTSPGGYFVTLCTQDRSYLFGRHTNGSLILNDTGLMVQALWQEIPASYPGVGIDAFVVMPNHLHGIILLFPSEAKLNHSTLSLGDVVGRFKSLSMHRYRSGVAEGRFPPIAGHFWQRSYHEHVIRDEADLARIRQYIADNPLRWAMDEENPERRRRSQG